MIDYLSKTLQYVGAGDCLRYLNALLAAVSLEIFHKWTDALNGCKSLE